MRDAGLRAPGARAGANPNPNPPASTPWAPEYPRWRHPRSVFMGTAFSHLTGALGVSQLHAHLAKVWDGCTPLRGIEALELDGVVFLMLRTATVQRLSQHCDVLRLRDDAPAPHAPPPLWVKVDGVGAPRVLSESEVAAQLPHLDVFVRALRHAPVVEGAQPPGVPRPRVP